VSNRYSERVGELGAGFVAQSLGFSAVKFQKLGNRTHGIDGIFHDPSTGKWLILEAKGGGNVLKGSQMSQKWIKTALKNVVPKDLREKLLDAAEGGKLLGGVAYTKFDGKDILDPTFTIKEWNNIGGSQF
jgi:hypothetical protein